MLSNLLIYGTSAGLWALVLGQAGEIPTTTTEVREVLIWALQGVAAVAWTIGGILLKRMFAMVDRLEERINQHERRIAHMEGRNSVEE